MSSICAQRHDKAAEPLAPKLGPMLAYLGRLTKRMEQERFPVDDELYRSAREAHNAGAATFTGPGWVGRTRGEQRATCVDAIAMQSI